MSLVALAAVLWLAFRPTARRLLHAISLGLILGGALGNLFDRVRYGSVIDFIDVGVGACAGGSSTSPTRPSPSAC